VPCVAFRGGSGTLDRPHVAVAPHGGDRVRRTALRDDIARTALAPTALSGHTEFELNFVEGHAGTHMTRDFAIGHSKAHANDHDNGFGWLFEEVARL